MTGGHTGEAVARHVSPDGKLVWRVQSDIEPDGSVTYSAGFEGLPWHVHPDQLRRSGTPLDKLLAVTNDLVTDRLIVVEETRPVSGKAGETQAHFWLLVDLDLDLQVKDHDESWALRFWSGTAVSVEDLIDGKVAWQQFDQKYFADEPPGAT